jgi:hypothetical protein
MTKRYLFGRALTRPERSSRYWAKREGHVPVDPTTVRPIRTAGQCDYCHSPAKVICLDHDHETGRFRGWLCNRCNTAFACFGDNEDGLIRALSYVRGLEYD